MLSLTIISQTISTPLPSRPQPTKSPTPAPTQSPTHGPLTAIQSGFFCATDWNDAITNCKMRCPSGEDPECPVGEFVSQLTLLLLLMMTVMVMMTDSLL